MKFDVGVPSGAIKHFETWAAEGHLNDFAIAAERAGLDSVSVTDHPFPPDEWLANGGHHAFDPFVALMSMGAATSRIGLRTNLLVAGYRNPYLTARSIASLDVLSGGRTIVAMGAGYLEPEFRVLGAEFADRGRRFDDAIEAMTAAWTGRSVTITEGAFAVDGHTMLPRPVQQPRPPIWVGGNSRRAMRRAALLADGWVPLPQGETMATITRSPPLTSMEQLSGMIAEIRRWRDEAGRDEPFDIAFGSFGRHTREDDPSGAAWRDEIAELERAGITSVSIGCRGRSLGQCIDELAWLGENIVAPLRA